MVKVEAELREKILEVLSDLDPKTVDQIHRNSDIGKRAESQHHRLGSSSTDASPGTHNHDGSNSQPLLDGTVFTGSRTTAVASILNQICNALATLGANNSTSA